MTLKEIFGLLRGECSGRGMLSEEADFKHFCLLIGIVGVIDKNRVRAVLCHGAREHRMPDLITAETNSKHNCFIILMITGIVTMIKAAAPQHAP